MQTVCSHAPRLVAAGGLKRPLRFSLSRPGDRKFAGMFSAGTSHQLNVNLPRLAAPQPQHHHHHQQPRITNSTPIEASHSILALQERLLHSLLPFGDSSILSALRIQACKIRTSAYSTAPHQLTPSHPQLPLPTRGTSFRTTGLTS